MGENREACCETGLVLGSVAQSGLDLGLFARNFFLELPILIALDFSPSRLAFRHNEQCYGYGNQNDPIESHRGR